MNFWHDFSLSYNYFDNIIIQMYECVRQPFTFRHGQWRSLTHAHTLAHTYVCILYMHTSEQRHMGIYMYIIIIINGRSQNTLMCIVTPLKGVSCVVGSRPGSETRLKQYKPVSEPNKLLL